MSERLPLREYTAFRYSAPSGSCKCGKCQLVPHAVVAYYADAIDCLKAERGELLAQRDALNGDVWKFGQEVAKLTEAFEAVRFKLELLAVDSELAQDALECLTAATTRDTSENGAPG